MHGERYGDPLSKRVCVYERAMCEKEGKQHSSAVCDVCRQDEAIQALVCSGWGRDVSLNDDDESAEASQGVRPRSWSCKGGCGGYPFKQASRRTIQGQTVRQPNESPAPPAMPDLTFSCISSPCTSADHRLSEPLPGPAVLREALLNSSAAESTANCCRRTRPRSYREVLFWSCRLLGPIRVPAFVKLRHECVSKDVYHLPLFSRVHESRQTRLTLCLNLQTLCCDRHGLQWHLEHRNRLETSSYARRCVPSRRRSSVCAQLEPKDAPKWSAGERSLDTNWCHLTLKFR